MNTLTRFTSLSTALLFVAGATACNVHDNTINIPNATINATADANASNVAPIQQVAITVTAQNVYLVDPATPPPAEHVEDAGHFQIYLDSTDTPPLLITAQTMFSVTVPADTKPGPHNLICRVHKHDGTPTSTEVNVAITVVASVGADGGVDVTTSVDANVTTDAGAGGAGGVSGAGGAGH
jgi:hypothetical protein